MQYTLDIILRCWSEAADLATQFNTSFFKLHEFYTLSVNLTDWKLEEDRRLETNTAQRLNARKDGYGSQGTTCSDVKGTKSTRQRRINWRF